MCFAIFAIISLIFVLIFFSEEHLDVVYPNPLILRTTYRSSFSGIPAQNVPLVRAEGVYGSVEPVIANVRNALAKYPPGCLKNLAIDRFVIARRIEVQGEIAVGVARVSKKPLRVEVFLDAGSTEHDVHYEIFHLISMYKNTMPWIRKWPVRSGEGQGELQAGVSNIYSQERELQKEGGEIFADIMMKVRASPSSSDSPNIVYMRREKRNMIFEIVSEFCPAMKLQDQVEEPVP